MTSKPPLTLLRTAAGSPPSVTQYRAFQKLGFRVVAADCDPLAVGFRFADKSCVVPRVREAGYLPRMLEICERERIGLFLPALDEELLICANERARFEALGTRLMVASPETLRVCTDKLLTYRRFSEHGIKTPKTVACEEYREGMLGGYPLIIKPRRGRGSTGVHLAGDAEEAAFYVRRSLGTGVVQERLSGVEHTIDVLADEQSQVRILSARKRISTDSGISSQGLTEHRPDFLEPVSRIVSSLKLVGPLNIQCFTAPSGEVSFTEVNARMAGTAILSQAAGVPYFEGIRALLLGEPVPLFTGAARPVLMLRYWEEAFVDIDREIDTIGGVSPKSLRSPK